MGTHIEHEVEAMMSRIVLFGWLAAWLITASASADTPDLQRQKSAVVKVTSQLEGNPRTGTGFIVKVEPDAVYIATASHVVEGDDAPMVEFFTARNRRVKAEIVKLEKADPKGLGLLLVRGREKIPADLAALALDTDAELEGADEVMTIGFGQGQGDWAVLKAQVVSVDGRDLKLDGRIDEGNSGGPVLKNGKVVGLITSSQRGLGLATPAQFVKFVLKSWGVSLPPAATASASAALPRTAAPRVEAPRTQTPKRERVETLSDTQAPANVAARAEDIGRRYEETARAAIDKMDRAAPAAPPGALDGPLTWQDHALRYAGTFIDDAENPMIRARVFDLRTNKEIGTYEVPIVPDLSLAPAVVIFTMSFDIPGDSTTPQPHSHVSNLHFRLQSDNSGTLIQNCDESGSCYPAQGKVGLD